MATIHNSELIKELKDGGKIQQLRDRIPQELADKVVPVMEVNPKLLRRTNIVFGARRESSGGTTLMTTDSVKETFITGIAYSITKDVACDMATANNVGVSIVQDGATRNIILASILTLTAQDKSVFVEFEPMKIDKGTTVVIISNAFAAGTCQRTATIFGYTVDNPNA